MKALEDDQFFCHHEALLDIARAGIFLSMIGTCGVVAGLGAIRLHEDPNKAPQFGIVLLVMGLLVAIPSFAALMIRQWAWIDVGLMHVVQSRRLLMFRWVDRTLPLDGHGAFLVKLFNEQDEPEARYFGCYYKHGFNEIVLLEADTEAEAEEHAVTLRKRFPHRFD